MVIGLPEIHIENDGICIGCALGNNAKGYFLRRDTRSRGILDFVQSYLCGSMTVDYLSGYLYYIIFVDD
jgi:hypothetical protein